MGCVTRNDDGIHGGAFSCKIPEAGVAFVITRKQPAAIWTKRKLQKGIFRSGEDFWRHRRILGGQIPYTSAIVIRSTCGHPVAIRADDEALISRTLDGDGICNRFRRGQPPQPGSSILATSYEGEVIRAECKGFDAALVAPKNTRVRQRPLDC